MIHTGDNTMIIIKRALAAGALALVALVGHAQQKQEVVKVAFIDPITGPAANIGLNILRTMQFLAERQSKAIPGAPRLEIEAFDNKGSPQETLTVFKSAVDRGYRYVIQSVGSGAAAALIDAVNKHNERNPGKEVVYLNYAANDPVLTNEKCSFWHFRFEADTSMKVEAMTASIKEDPKVKRLFLINQNYAHGQQMSRLTKEMLARRRAEVEIVGDELHPLMQVKDFSPFIAKIKASGADTVLTGNWGNDLALLIKAAKDSGLDVTFYTMYATQIGLPTVLGASGEGRVKALYSGHSNVPELRPALQDYKARFKEDYSVFTIDYMIRMLLSATVKAKSNDPVAVARALEGLSLKSYGGDITMRASDHQLQMPLYLATWHKKGPRDYDVEGTGFTWVQDKVYPPYVSSTPTSCQMKRPA
jgi:branched-chain amino acid transport system substrate-binding protein